MNKNITKITLPFDILPQIEGYRPHQDEIQSKLFPNCCDFHQGAYNALEEWFKSDFEIFAQSVEKKIGVKLNITDYFGLPLRLVTQLSYMEYFLAKKIDTPHWFRDFLHYLEYNIFALGMPTPSYLWYLSSLKRYLLKIDEKIERRKKELLIAELDYRIGISTGDTKFRSYSNPNLIRGTIQKWLSILPFKGKELKRFIKENEWQSLSGIIEINQFDARLDTVIPILIEDVIDDLKYETTRLLSKIKNSELYQKLTKAELVKRKLKLVGENHQLKQNKLLREFSLDEFSYIDILEKWLKNEEEFIGKYVEIVETQTIQSNTIPSGLKTFSTSLSATQLKMLREQLIAYEIISQIDKEDFLRLFKAQPILQSMTRIDWLKANSWCSDLLKRIVYTKKKRWISKQVNGCIIGMNNKLIATNSYHGEIPEISEILKSIMKK